MHKLAGVLDGEPSDNFYRHVISHWLDPETRRAGRGDAPLFIADDPRVARWSPNPIERMQYLDTLTYLPDDILTKVDRASMAVSLEARVPLLDHRVVAFSWRCSSR